MFDLCSAIAHAHALTHRLRPMRSHLVNASRLSIFGLLLTGTTVALAQDGARIAKAFHEQQQRQILSDFVDLLRLPNVADQQANMMANAVHISRYVEQRGFHARTVTAGGAPYIVAERSGTEGAPSVLIYAHFDGQPVIPDDWASPPFEPTLWTAVPGTPGAAPLNASLDQIAQFDPEWRLVARSAGDDKAPVIALMAAIDALEQAGAMPDITIKLILDGEEERGSPTLAGILDQVKDDLAADVMLFCDGPMHQSRRRQLVLGVRGSMTVDVKTFGANRPLHSGHYGNWSPNPSETLMRVLLSLKDEHGMPVVDGFADDVTPVSPLEHDAIARMPAIDAQLKQELGLGANEQADERIEAAIMRPAIVVRGVYGGGVGAQGRNIIEPEASASLNIRLVPGQTPERVADQLKRHVEAQGFTVSDQGPAAHSAREQHVQMAVRPGGYRAFRTPIDDPIVTRLKTILDRLDDDETLITPTMGGSLPIYRFEDELDMPIVILPVANHDNNQHGRNENLRLKNLFDAVEMYAEILTGLAAAD